MENQRIFFIIALSMVLLLIWQAWVQDQTQLRALVSQTESDLRPSLPSLPERATPESERSPNLSLPEVNRGVLERSDRIMVKTDIFVAEIDTLGGDLRRLGLRTHPNSLQDPTPFALLHDDRELFVVQSGLLSTHHPAPDHYQVYSSAQTEYVLKDGENTLEVPLVWRDESGIEVIKTYVFHRGRFDIELVQQLRNQSPTPWAGTFYRQIQRSRATNNLSAFAVYTYTGGVISTPERVYEKISFDDMVSRNLEREVSGGWLAMIQHYFLAALVPDHQAQINHFYSRNVGNDRFVLGMVSPSMQAAPEETIQVRSILYAGPKIQADLAKIAPHLDLTVDYGWLSFISQPLFWALNWIYSYVGNWGWAIIILTLLIKLAFYKLSETSYRSMAKMRKVAPLMQQLKERYGSDPQKMNQELMAMYRKEKINPLGGCLPILVQIPVFIALYWVLVESVELRQAPWIGWIEDLSIKDPLYILPLIMGGSMFVQQWLSPPPPDPIQAKVMMFLPVMFTVFFLWFPAGLVLYWAVNNCVSIAQQYVITKRVEAEDNKGLIKATKSP